MMANLQMSRYVLTQKEAEQRLKQYGLNRWKPSQKRST
ncbi:cation-transporting P-type ATPase [Nitrosomonas communis]